MSDIEMFIDKDCGKFIRRFVIDWKDGAKTEIVGRKIVLHGRDGVVYPIGNKCEHRKICRQVLKEEGF